MLTVHCHNKCFQNFLCIPLLLGRTVLQHHGGQGAILLTGAKQNIIRGHFQDGGDVAQGLHRHSFIAKFNISAELRGDIKLLCKGLTSISKILSLPPNSCANLYPIYRYPPLIIAVDYP